MIYPAFVENEKFFSLDSSQSELDRTIRLAESLKKIHFLTNKHYHDFDTLILEYLNTGIEIFGMKIGIVSNIVKDDYIICNAISPDNSIHKNDIFALQDTYCREVFHSSKVLGFPHVGGLEEMKDHPVYQNMKLEAYISAPIFVSGELFGTLNFTSTTPRDNGFSEHERDLISLMADSIGAFLVLSQKEKDLSSANDRLKRLSGFVSHDLRGPLLTIRSFAELLKNGVDPAKLSKIADMILLSANKGAEMVETILESAAMGTGKIEMKMETVDFSELFLKRIDAYQSTSLNKEFSFQIDCDQELFVSIDPQRMEQVLNNLISNTVKYTPAKGKIIFVAKRSSDDGVTVTITNDLQESTKSANKKFDSTMSVGFGLEIVRDILLLHNSKLSIDFETGVYIVNFHLPKQR